MAQKNSWKQVKTSSHQNTRPSSRWGHCSCVVNDQIVLFGGYANSIYMNDMWVFNSISMEWRQVKTTGQVPSYRSNCSLNYDTLNNRLVLFGGGGQNKRRFNQINLLDWQTKQWTNISFKDDETAPWERTYHSAQLLYPYLIVFGGEGVADLDDLWVYNFANNKWQQVTFPHNAVRPCGRRFHSSCLVNNQFFVIAGCYSKYRPLNDIYSIDLTKLIETGSVQGLQWKQRVLNQQGFLTRWGQSTAVQGKNIYIFGGRFSNDLNDMLVYDSEKNKMRVFKVSNDQIPKPRRRSSLNFIGNCLLMFGGFNSDYYNDLHYINISQAYLKQKIIKDKKMPIKSLLKDEKLSDIKIESVNGKTFYCHKGVLRQYIKNEAQLTKLIEAINKKQQQKELQQMLQCLYRGYGNNKLLNKYLIDIPEDLQERQNNFNKFIDEFKGADANTQSIAQLQKNKTQNIIQLKESQFSQYVQNCQQNNYKDIIIKVHSNVDGQIYNIASNKILLLSNSKYFQGLLMNKFKNCEQQQIVNISLNCEGLDKLQILLNYLITGHLVVPAMSYAQWIQLYNLADYLAFNEIQSIILNQLYTLINQNSLDQIYKFSLSHNIEDLSIACARFKLYKNCPSKISQNSKHYQISYNQNRFQIKQQLMTKNPPLVFKHKNSNAQNMQDEKENYQTCQN